MSVNRSRAVVGLFVVVSMGLGACASSEPERDEVVAVATEGLTAADCPAGYNIIQGTSAANTLIGTAGNDCILGLGGADTIWGRGGDDFIAGGNGDDTINGEGGNDRLYGEAGIDTIHGGDNNDTIHGDDGGDFLYGDNGDDIIDGDANADQIFGGDGDDIIYGDAANDTMQGEAGDDALIGGAGTNTANGGTGIDACSGTNCEKPQLTLSGCTQNSQCGSGKHCIADFGLCIGCVSDQDNDLVCDSKDGCPNNAQKTAPGACGCAVADTDSDGDGTPNCNDQCPNNAPKTAPGACGCAVADTDSDGDGTPNCNDACPSDPIKIAAGACGCAVADTDSDGDGTPNCNDGCPSNAPKTAPGVCGCAVADTDSDGDGTPNCNDQCPNNAPKTAPGVCGCAVSDADTDGDGARDCRDSCPADAACSTFPADGALMAHAEFHDFDANGTFETTSLGAYPVAGTEWFNGTVRVHRAAFEFNLASLPPGAQVTSAELVVSPTGASYPPEGWQLEIWGYAANGTIESADVNRTDTLLHEHLIGPNFFFNADVSSFVAGAQAGDFIGLLLRAADEHNPNGGTLTLGALTGSLSLHVEYFVACGTDGDSDGDGVCNAADVCPGGSDRVDQDGDGTPNACDGCPTNAAKTAPGQCGCAVPDTDGDGDGTANCNDGCPTDATKVVPGQCGCGVPDADGDGDGTVNCLDGCASDPTKIAPGACGCGAPETDSDADGTPDCIDRCPGSDDRIDVNADGIPDGCESCLYDSQCSDGNVCTGTERCIAGQCAAGTALNCNDQQDCTTDSCNPTSGCTHAALGVAPIRTGNGDFETGALAPSSNYTLTNSRATVVVVTAQTAAHLPASKAVRFYVGREPISAPAANSGGGITQTVTTRSGTLIATVSASANSGSTGNSVGGWVRLTIDNMEYALQDFGALSAGVPKYAALTLSKPVNPGPHEIKVEVTRNSGYTELVALYLDELQISGSAVDGNVSTSCNSASGFCVAGSCMACLRNADCDDNNPCTQDSCQSSTSCQHVALPGQACGAGGQCAADASCSAPTIDVAAPFLVGDTFSDGFQNQWSRFFSQPTFYVQLYKRGSTSTWIRRRATMEFNIAQAPSAASVVSAHLTLTPNGGGNVNLRMCSYKGNGVVDLTPPDSTLCSLDTGVATAGGTWPIVVDVTAAVKNVLSQSGTIVGFNLQSIREQDASPFDELVTFYGASDARKPYLELELVAP